MQRYRHIMADLEQKMADGLYRSGQKLPSVREAAKLYSCSTGTIARVYDELERRHAVYSISQSGHYVVERVEPRDMSSGPVIDFSSALPDSRLFPYLDFQHCMNKAIDTYQHHIFSYGEPAGLGQLRRTLSAHLAGDQVFAKAEHIVITSGSNQALEALAKLPFPGGADTVLVEQPTYDLYLRYLEEEGIPVLGIRRTDRGLDLEGLEERFRQGNIKFFYCMPRFHNPLGTSLSPEERKAVAELAGRYKVYVVEDDYMADLGYDQGAYPIYAYDRSSHVIYLKSFSKMIFPGLRVGAAVLPKALLEPFLRARRIADTSLLSQAALDIYLKSGMYERHKHQIGNRYRARMLVLREALYKHGAGTWLEAGAGWNGIGAVVAGRIDEEATAELVGEADEALGKGDAALPTHAIHVTPEGADADKIEALDILRAGNGIYLHLELPRQVNMERLVKRLAARQVMVMPGKGFYIAGYLEKSKFLRISVSRVEPEQIEEGAKAISEELIRELQVQYPGWA